MYIKNESVPIVIPSYEPDEALLLLCERLKNANLTNVIIVDDGSGESYQAIFEQIRNEYKFIVLEHRENKGKGRALKTAFSYIIDKDERNTIGCVTADSDGQHLVSDIEKCIEALSKNTSSLIMGCRTFDGDNIPNKSKLGNKITCKAMAYICGLNISDTQTGLRGIPIEFMQKLLQVKGERFEFETNMLIYSKDEYKIVEVPIKTIYDSKTNHKTHFNPVTDSIKIYWLLIKVFAKYIISSFSSCIIDLLVFTFFCFLLKERMPQFYIMFATVGARIISSAFNCIVNYHVVFKTNKKGFKDSAIRYFSLALIQMTLSAILVTFFAEVFHHIINDTFVKAIVDMILFFISYYIQMKFVF